MQIKLKSLGFVNFKGIVNLQVGFDETTTIFGDNGKFKSSIFDGFTWLLFGKDSNERKDFEVKTLTPEGKVIEKLDHEVEGFLEVDGKPLKLKRVLREKWVKKRGTEHTEFTGNETIYFIDDVPLSKTDYEKKISSIINEDVFKLITSPTAFNALKWEKRREFLIEVAGGLDDMEILQSMTGTEALVAILSGGKTIAEYKKQIAASLKKQKEELETIPTRIDEANRSKPELPEGGFDPIKEKLATKEADLITLDESIQSQSTAFDQVIADHNAEKLKYNGLKGSITAIETNARAAAKKNTTPDTSTVDKTRQDLNSKETMLKSEKNSLQTLESKAASLATKIAGQEKDIVAKREMWATENAKTLVFAEGVFCCPTCERELDEATKDSKRAEMQAKFDTDKAATLAKIKQEGIALASEKENADKELADTNSRIEQQKKTIELVEKAIPDLKKSIAEWEETQKGPVVSEETEYQAIIKSNAEYQKLVDEALPLLQKIETDAKNLTSPAVEELKAKRKPLVEEIDALKKSLLPEEQIEKANVRIEALKAEEKKIAQEIAETEKTQFVIERFNKTKIQTIEERINGKFNLVKFKMFEEQINGGEAETCICTIGGVPYLDANTASKINAGIDIINALCNHYGVTAPIFVDNRESVINLLETPSQLVNLVAMKGAKLSINQPEFTEEYLREVAEKA